MRVVLLFGRRNRDIPVYREFPLAERPRVLSVGDVVRDRLFPLAIERVASVNETANAVVFESGDHVPTRWCARAYEHADGAPISRVQR
jgi:hypothetical protein